jgi:imidazolonepropionase-like amidohydrolase
MIVIRNANVLSFTGHHKDTIIIDENGKIAAVGLERELAIPQGAELIDAQGRLVTPGLIDAHTHLGIDEEGIGWEGDDYNESSEAVTPHMRAIDGVNPFDQGFEDAARAGVTTVQVLPGSANVIGGLTCVLKVKPGFVVDDMIVKSPAGLKIAFGENPKKFHGKQGRSPETRLGVAGLLREQLTKAVNYMLRIERGEAETDLRMEALSLALKRDIPVVAHVHRADDIMTAIRIAKEFRLDLSIEHTTEGHKIAEHIARAGVRVSVGPTLSSRSKVELRDKDWKTYSVMEAHGIPFAIITDHPVVPIEHLMTTAQWAMKSGLSELGAWKALTTNAARHLGVEDRLGSVEAGMDADIVIWSDNPLTRGGEAVLTMVDGSVTYRSLL